MQLGMIGLGRMGANLVRRLMQRRPRVRRLRRQRRRPSKELEGEGAVGATSLAGLRAPSSTRRAPSGSWCRRRSSTRTLDELAPLLAAGDIIIDGGNSYYHDDIDRAARLTAERHPLRRRRHERRRVRARARLLPDDRRRGRRRRAPRPDLRDARPGRRRRAAHARPRAATPARPSSGYLHCGPNGAGHFVKMVHNGIEYGIMAAYAEGLEHPAARRTSAP